MSADTLIFFFFCAAYCMAKIKTRIRSDSWFLPYALLEKLQKSAGRPLPPRFISAHTLCRRYLLNRAERVRAVCGTGFRVWHLWRFCYNIFNKTVSKGGQGSPSWRMILRIVVLILICTLLTGCPVKRVHIKSRAAYLFFRFSMRALPAARINTLFALQDITGR